ncbi:MAG: hypothetical protein IT444_01320 [Phycisphaeraceae bacterium]|nr:hypothetical protein [Phycisphaeraceae bacterium]
MLKWDRCESPPPLLDQRILAAARVETYKSDARSTVWRTETPEGAWVVKRFEYSPLRQRVSLILGIHPGQRERRANAELVRQEMPAVPLVGWVEQRVGLGCKIHLVTPYAGESLQRLLRSGLVHDAEWLRRTLPRVGELASRLVEGRWFLADLKTANIVIDKDGQPRVIDVGRARRCRSRAKTTQMLAVLEDTLKKDGLAEEVCRQCVAPAAAAAH